MKHPISWLMIALIGVNTTVLSAESERRSLNNGQLWLEGVPAIPESVVEDVHRFENVRSAGFIDWTTSGEGMYIRTRFGQVTQIHRVDAPLGARIQLTYFDEPVREAHRSYTDDRIALTMDRGGDEANQIFLLDADTGRSRLLSDGHSRNSRVVWDHGGKRIAFQTTRRNGRDNDVWIMVPARPDSATPLIEADDGALWYPVEFSPDGSRLLVQQFISVADSRIYLLDIATRDLILMVGGGEYESSNMATGFGARGNGFYFVTNQRGLAADLAWMDLDPASEPIVLSTGIKWDVRRFVMSPDGRRAALVTNEDGISRLYLFDPRRRKLRRVEDLPVGVLGNIGFSPDNRRLALTLSTARTPNDVYVLELSRDIINYKELVRWTRSEVGGLDTDRFVMPKLIRYPTFDKLDDEQRQIPAFLYQPEGDGPFPVIITIHGGPEGQFRPQFNSSVHLWVNQLGAAVVAPNVRGSVGYDRGYVSLDDGMLREDAVRDIGALLDWIAANPQLDEKRVGVIGGSYGGYMVLASAAAYGDRIHAAVDRVGISNFVSFLENTEDYRRDLRRAEYGDERDPEMRAYLERISPLNNVDRMRTPMLIVQGQNDPRVPPSESEKLVTALRERGQTVWHINALNEGHGFRRKDNRSVYQQVALMFFREFLLD